jgi:hypothetical protein
MVAFPRRSILSVNNSILASLILLAPQLYAQASGRITGRVIDATQVGVPQATSKRLRRVSAGGPALMPFQWVVTRAPALTVAD